MSRRNKRASMREGPLSDLFRSTADEGQADRPAGPDAAGDPPPPPVAKASSEAGPPTAPPAGDASAPYDQEPESSSPEGHSETPPERLKRVFSEEPSHARRELEPIVESPRYGREEPEYEPPGSGEPHQPVIRVVGVGGGGVNAVNRMVEARIPGVEFMAVNTDLQSPQPRMAAVTPHIGEEATRRPWAGAAPPRGHRSRFGEQEKIKRLLKGSDMVFVAAGAGGCTGSVHAPSGPPLG